MSWPIEKLSVSIENKHTKTKRHFVKMSAYVMEDQKDINVLVSFRRDGEPPVISLFYPIDEDAVKTTNMRTYMLNCIVDAKGRVETAMEKLAKIVLETKSSFDPYLVSIVDDCIRYCGRGFSELKIKV